MRSPPEQPTRPASTASAGDVSPAKGTELSVEELLTAASRAQELKARLHELEARADANLARHNDELATVKAALNRESEARGKTAEQALIREESLAGQRNEALAALKAARADAAREKTERQQAAKLHDQQLADIRAQLDAEKERAGALPRREQAMKEATAHALAREQKLARERDEAIANLARQLENAERAKTQRQHAADLHEEHLSKLAAQLDAEQTKASTLLKQQQEMTNAAERALTREQKLVRERDESIANLATEQRKAEREKTQRQHAAELHEEHLSKLAAQLHAEQTKASTLLKQQQETTDAALAATNALEQRLAAEVTRTNSIREDAERRTNSERAAAERRQSGHRAQLALAAIRANALTRHLGKAEEELYRCARDWITWSAKAPDDGAKAGCDERIQAIEDLLTASPNAHPDWRKTISAIREDVEQKASSTPTELERVRVRHETQLARLTTESKGLRLYITRADEELYACAQDWIASSSRTTDPDLKASYSRRVQTIEELLNSSPHEHLTNWAKWIASRVEQA